MKTGGCKEYRLKCYKACCSYQDSAGRFLFVCLFFLIKSPLVVARLWLISKVLKKFILTVFCQCSYCFYGGMDFRRSLLCHSGISSLGNPVVIYEHKFSKILKHSEDLVMNESGSL